MLIKRRLVHIVKCSACREKDVLMDDKFREEFAAKREKISLRCRRLMKRRFIGRIAQWMLFLYPMALVVVGTVETAYSGSFPFSWVTLVAMLASFAVATILENMNNNLRDRIGLEWVPFWSSRALFMASGKWVECIGCTPDGNILSLRLCDSVVMKQHRSKLFDAKGNSYGEAKEEGGLLARLLKVRWKPSGGRNGIHRHARRLYEEDTQLTLKIDSNRVVRFDIRKLEPTSA